jgi:hypothetical protein
MKFWVFIYALLCLNYVSIGQDIDRTLKFGAEDIAKKVIKKNKSHLAIADFVNNVGKTDALTTYITQQVEMNLVNAEGDIGIIDRNHIKQLLSENHLASEGLIDETTAKSAVSFIKVDGWVMGEVTSFGDQIKITIKVVDVISSMMYAAYTSELITDPAIKKLLESTEVQKQPTTPVNNDCLVKNTGDYCFTNTTNQNVIVHVTAIYTQVLSLSAGQKQCFYNLKAGTYQYEIWKEDNAKWKQFDINSYPGSGVPPDARGQIRVEQCKSPVFTIN